MNSKTSNLVIRKCFFTGVSIVGCIAAIYFFFIVFLVSGGYRDYQNFCSEYIPKIEQYHSENMSYPESLSDLKKPKYSPRHKIEDCGYAKTKESFSFFAPEGLMGVAIYDSLTKKWVHD